jgi:hypothetical protein
MSDRYTGGILSGTAPTVTQQSANGVYTLSQELQYQGQGVWPAAAQTPILKSLRFRKSASAYLNRTPASATNRRTWTLSAWVKKSVIDGDYPAIFNAGTSAPDTVIRFNAGDTLSFTLENGGGSNYGLTTTAVYRDPSAWYHVLAVCDTTQATSSDRLKLYINGVQVTAFGTANYPSQNFDAQVNNTVQHKIGAQRYAAGYMDGYMGEVNFIDGVALTPSSFGTTDANGIWQPIPYTGAYGTNGFYLPFTNTTSTSTLGNDSSGNGNNWTVNNISLTSGNTYDSMLDSPSNANPSIANYAVLNAISTGGTITNGNLKYAGASYAGRTASIGVTSGKWYCEFTILSLTNSFLVGVYSTENANGTYPGATATSWGYYSAAGTKYNSGAGTSYGSSYTTNDVIGVALDMDNGTLTFYKNGTSQGVAFSTGISGKTCFFGGAGYDATDTFAINFGQQPFSYTPPTGFNRLNTYNLPVPTIPAGNKYMEATTYTGNGSTQSIVNAAPFKPDLVWIKMRSGVAGNELFDSVRGANIVLFSNATNAETNSGTMSAFNSNGFTAVYQAADISTNNSGSTFVGWQWQAGQGVTSSNTDGTITSTVSVNQAAGFSVVTFTAQTSGSGTIGHGLGVAPAFVIVKTRATAGIGWATWNKTWNGNQFIQLNTTDAVGSLSTIWNGTTPTSTVFNLGSAYAGLGTMVAYCWSEIAGFSAFGSYTGNGSTDGAFIYTGFRPKFVMVKRTDTSGYGWIILDTARNPYNVSGNYLSANTSDAENNLSGPDSIDFLSNGWKNRYGSYINDSGGTYIYMAFAENPFKMARAR